MANGNESLREVGDWNGNSRCCICFARVDMGGRVVTKTGVHHTCFDTCTSHVQVYRTQVTPAMTMKCSYYSCGKDAVVREAKESPAIGEYDIAWCYEHAKRYGGSYE